MFGHEQTQHREDSIEDSLTKAEVFDKDLKHQFSSDLMKKMGFGDEKIEEVHSPIHIEEKQANLDEQFSFDKDFNFNADDNKDCKPIETEDLQSNDMSEIIDYDDKNLVNDLSQIDHRFDLKLQSVNHLCISRVGTFPMSADRSHEAESWFALGSHGSRTQSHAVRAILDNWAQVELGFKYYGRGIPRYFVQASMVVNSIRTMAYAVNVFYLLDVQPAEKTNTKQPNHAYSGLESPHKKLSDLIQFCDISPIADKKFKTIEESTKRNPKKLALSFLAQLLNSSASSLKAVRDFISSGTPFQSVSSASLSLFQLLFSTLTYKTYSELLWNPDHVLVKIMKNAIQKQGGAKDGDQIEQLSSIESADKEEELEDRAVLQSFQQAKQALKRNDDVEYKQRELRNLSKYRERSQVSNKSEFRGLKID